MLVVAIPSWIGEKTAIDMTITDDRTAPTISTEPLVFLEIHFLRSFLSFFSLLSVACLYDIYEKAQITPSSHPNSL